MRALPGVLLLLLAAPPSASVAQSPAADVPEVRLFPPSWAPASPGVVTRGPVSPLGVEALVGEPVNGFPNWQERVLHQWINRARVDPQADLADCPTGNCAENIGTCYTPQVPLIWSLTTARLARFHSAEMGRQNFRGHDSHCTLVSNISSLYPASCNGSASCACVGGTSVCNPTCTGAWDRFDLFGIPLSYLYSVGEIIAWGSSLSPNDAFYAWLWERSTTTACEFTLANGHRWNILKADGALGAGYELLGQYIYTVDFGGLNSPIPKIPSGAHYPQQAASIDFWANWKDASAPQSAAVNVDGVCIPMTLARGTNTNGAWSATNVSGLGTGCHRYYFVFVDSGGNEVTLPSTGSYGIGPTATCGDWEATRPASCTSGPASYYALPPCRVVNTRLAVGPLGGPSIGSAGSPDRSFPLAAGTCGVPTDARAVALNITVADATGPGYVTVYPGGTTAPATSTLNFALDAKANNAIVPVASDGNASVAAKSGSTGSFNLLIDVTGYFR